MSIVDSRLENLRSHIQGSSSVLAASSGSAHRSFLVAEGNSGHIDLSSVLRSMKMEIPKFDGSDPNGWVFRIEEFFFSMKLQSTCAFALSRFTSRGERQPGTNR